jgi:hypothetical protein
MEAKSIPLPDLDTVVWTQRPVVIAFDSDSKSNPSVRAAQSKLAKELTARGAQVRVLKLPPDADGGKVGLDDYLLSHRQEAFQALVEATPLWGSPEKSGRSGESDEASEDERGSQADRLVRLVAAEGAELFHDQIDDTFAAMPLGGHREIWPCRGKQLKRWLAGRLWHAEGRAAGSEALAAALNVIEAQARWEGEERELHNRVALYQGAIWYDLADRDWRAIRVTPSGWDIIVDPPILFRRYSHQRPQPTPVRGGGLHELRRFVNLRDDAHVLLCQVYLVCCFVPGISHPIPDVHGGQGAAKTTFLRVLRRLGDPSVLEVLSLPHDHDQLVQQLAHNWMPCYDNVTHLPDWASDALCRAATGAGIAKRELYTNDDDVIYQYRRCPGINGINTSAQKPDLLDRCLLFELEGIPRSQRRPEEEFWTDFEEARPRLLGAIFDVLSQAMALRNSIRLPGLPRMADFAVWGCAVAQALGCRQEDFLAAYDRNMEIRNDEALQASPVAMAVVALMEARDQWEGTASQLLAELDPLAVQQRVNINARGWPKAPHALTRAMNKVRPNLAAAGIGVQSDKDGNGRWVRIHRTTGDGVSTVTSVTEAPGPRSDASERDAIAGRPAKASAEASGDCAPADAEDDSNDAMDAHDAFSRPLAEGRPATGRPKPDRPCFACRGGRFWLDSYAIWKCGTCHPPANPNAVQKWFELDDGADEQQLGGQIVMRNALHPDQMPPDDRLREVASLLAAGFLRHWAARAVDGGEKGLDVLRTSSEVCPKPTSEGESL